MMQDNKKYATLITYRAAFTLIEIVAAITVLALIVSTSLAIINNSLEAAVNIRMRTAAFELARENMERLLGATSAHEMVEYGRSETVQGLTWEIRVEPFHEPHTSNMWLRAVSSASWHDADRQLQTMEFTHWLTDLSPSDIEKILQRQREQQAALDAYELAEMLDLFSRAAMAHKAASAEGYEEMVALCRQLIRDYPDTILANSAKVLLREMPPAEQVRFDIQPYETTPVPIIAFDPAAGLGDHAAGPQMLGGYTWAEIEQMVINDHEKFMLIIMESLAVGR